MTSPPRGDFGSASSGYGSASRFGGSPFIEEDNPFADLASSRNTPPIAVIPDPIMSPPGKSVNSVQWLTSVATSPAFEPSLQQPLTSPNRSTSQQKPATSTARPATRSSPISSRRRPAGSRLSQSVVSKLEDLGLESDPLGPLGETGGSDTVAPPPPPAKDDSPSARQTRQQPATTFSEIKAEIETPRFADPARPQPSPVSRQLSTPLEQAAQQPTFHITVGDPTTIGNITGSHTEYKVRTKVIS
jgi:hypothetical protein